MIIRSLFFILISTLLLTACVEQTGYNDLLVQADSLMQSRPDSALYLLENITTDSLKTKADSAYYALLLTQARDKNYIAQTDDSLIRTAVYYFDSIDDINKQANAYYYWGNIYRDRGEYPTAVNRYYLALSRITPPNNGELHSALYSNIGYLYYIQGLNAKADSIYHEAELLAMQQADTMALCYALTQQGMLNLEKGKEYYPKAEQQMLQALSIGKTFSDNTILGPIYTSLSAFYNSVPDTVKALQYSRLNYSTKRDTVHCYRTFLYLGNAYFLNAQYDSASIFLQKIFRAERYYDTKADACMRLSEIAQLKGNVDSAIFLERKRAAYLDSARISEQGYATTDTVIPYERISDKNSYANHSLYIYGIFSIFSVIGIWSVLYLWRNNKQYKTEKREWEEKLRVKIKSEPIARELTEKQQQKLLLQEEINQLTVKKLAYAKEEYKTSAIYIKVTQIAKKLAKTDTRENLSEEEWNLFITLTNAGWNGVITYLNKNYNLSAEEIQICCLYLAQVPVKHMGHFVKGQVRSTIQSRSKDILLKIKAPKGMLLKNVLFSLTEKLENND